VRGSGALRWPMATQDFKSEISAALSKFIKANPNKCPSVLKVPHDDALMWGSKKDVEEGSVLEYVRTLRCGQKSLGDCKVEVMTAESNEGTHFV
jgi:hypothetical protein